MSFSPVVLAILAACWIAPAAVIAVMYGWERTSSTDEAPESGVREMERTDRALRARLETRPRNGDAASWLQQDEWNGSSNAIDSQVSGSVQEVTCITPYAEATVTVYDDAGDLCARRCSVCLN